MQYITILLLLIIITLILKKTSISTPTLVKKLSSRKVVLDTCALIDGRILALVNTGFVPEELIVPVFIVRELQFLADGSDAQKRERARYGLEVVQQLQANIAYNVVIHPEEFSAITEVDEKLVALAKKEGALLYTTDYNLNKVAAIGGVQVLNVNELAQNLRPVALPGELKNVKLIQKGSNKNQAVGYLEDGTMIVVDDGIRFLGETVQVEINRVFQTVAGKMLFGQMVQSLKEKNFRPTENKAKAQKVIPMQSRYRK